MAHGGFMGGLYWLPEISSLPMQIVQNRRGFLTGLSAASAAWLLDRQASAAGEQPPETTTVRLAKNSGICLAPQFVAEELLRAEGFTDVRYVKTEPGRGNSERLARGEIDFTLNFVGPLIVPIDAGEAVTVLAGVHVGCFELFGNKRIERITDLKGKSVGVQGLGSTPHVFLTAMASYVGLDPAKDINWVISTAPVKPMQLFIDGKIDAFLGFPPEPQELRAKKIGNVIVNSALDSPWSQYFCCMLAGNTDFINKHPIASKRVLRAILKAADLCSSEPERVAQRLVDGGFTARYDYALQTMGEVPYDRWRDYDPEDTMRFYALRLHEAGMIKSAPQRIISKGTNWSFLNELKRELKT
jgi:NitT/TauT family transport system substrate-binding protein